MSFRKNSDNSATLPVIIYSFKAYKQDNKRDIEPAGISLPDELGDTPFIRNPYLELPGSRRLESYRCGCRPIGWILEQLTGESNVVCFLKTNALL